MHIDESVVAKAKEFLDKHLMGVLATTNASGNPESSAMYYFIDDQDGLYFVAQKRSRKYANIMGNSRISFCVFDDRQERTVQMEGEAVVVANGMREFDFAAKLLKHPRLEALYRSSHLVKGYFAQLTDEDLAIFRVSLAWVRYGEIDAQTQEIHYSQLLPRNNTSGGHAGGAE